MSTVAIWVLAVALLLSIVRAERIRMDRNRLLRAVLADADSALVEALEHGKIKIELPQWRGGYDGAYLSYARVNGDGIDVTDKSLRSAWTRFSYAAEVRSQLDVRADVLLSDGTERPTTAGAGQ